MASSEVRQVVGVNGRALHMRRLGRGRPVVLLHESPRSSAALLPLATRLADHFTVFALDTPGYGWSDPLPMRRPEIADFADAVAASLRALGLRRVPVYGTHTGATIAAEMGRRHPDLVSGLVLDGYPVFTVAERDLHHAFYLPEFRPRWDGSHVAALWTRVRDQFDFFPWYALNESARLRTPKAPLERHRAVLRDFLAAGRHYSTAYAASFRFEALSVLQLLRVPTHVMARETDLLFSHLRRLGPLPDGCEAGTLPVDPDAWAAAVAARLGFTASDPAPPPPADRLMASPDGQKGVFDGHLLCRCYGQDDGKGPAVVLLHDTPGSALAMGHLAARLATGHRVVVPELPNHGISPDMPTDGAGLDHLCDRLNGLSAAWGPNSVVIGQGTGAVLGRRMAGSGGSSITRTIAIAPELMPPASPDEPLEPRWDGADLLADWFEARDHFLYGPGCDARTGPAPLTEIGFDIAAIHDRFRSRVLAAGQDRLYAATLHDDTRDVAAADLEFPQRAFGAGAALVPTRLADDLQTMLAP